VVQQDRQTAFRHVFCRGELREEAPYYPETTRIMENILRLAELENALERERQTMKRQELLRQIWRMTRSDRQESPAAGPYHAFKSIGRKDLNRHIHISTPQRPTSVEQRGMPTLHQRLSKHLTAF